MKLTDEERKAIVDYRFEKSNKAMQEAEDLARLGHWSLTAQRLYYAAYYVASAKLLEREASAKTHSGVINLLNLHFVKNGTLQMEQARVYAKLFAMRQTGDYDDYFDHTEEDVLPYIEKTKELIRHLKEQ